MFSFRFASIFIHCPSLCTDAYVSKEKANEMTRLEIGFVVLLRSARARRQYGATVARAHFAECTLTSDALCAVPRAREPLQIAIVEPSQLCAKGQDPPRFQYVSLAGHGLEIYI